MVTGIMKIKLIEEEINNRVRNSCDDVRAPVHTSPDHGFDSHPYRTLCCLERYV